MKIGKREKEIKAWWRSRARKPNETEKERETRLAWEKDRANWLERCRLAREEDLRR